ncbi:MAG: HAD family hydrolase [Eubacteriales bacterium]|nr:HAD family hydrolase [Eubacteriales bacterium]
MIKACIFDCDGTLLDTLESIGSSANDALVCLGYPEIPLEDYRTMVGDGVEMLMRRCLKRVGDEECARYEELTENYRRIFKEGCTRNVHPYDGIPKLLAELKTKGILTAVLSNKPHEETKKVITGAFGENTFSAILGARPDYQRKPAPDGALLLAEELQVKPEEVLYIGDTNTDMMTGNAAGMHTVGVLWGFRGREELEKNHAEHIVAAPEQIAALI